MAVVDVGNLQSAEVAATVGTGGRVSEFVDFSGLAGKAIGMVGDALTANKASAAASKLANFQVGSLEQANIAANQQFEQDLSGEELDFLKGAASDAEKLALAKRQGKGAAYLAIQRTTRLAKAIRENPALAPELTKIYAQNSNILGVGGLAAELEAEDEDNVVQQAADDATKEQVKNLQGLGYGVEALRTKSPAEIDDLYRKSGLAASDNLFKTADIQANILARGEEVNKLTMAKELRNFRAENPGAVQAFAGRAISGILDQVVAQGLGPEQSNQLLASSRAALVSQIGERFRLDESEVESQFKATLAQFDSAKNFDPTKTEAERIRNQLSITTGVALQTAYKNDDTLLRLNVLQEGLGRFSSLPSVLNQQRSAVISAAGSIIDNSAINYGAIQESLSKNPRGSVTVITEALLGEGSDPKAQATLDKTMLRVMNTPFDPAIESEIFTGVMSTLADPKVSARFAALASGDKYDRNQLEQVTFRLTDFAQRNITSLSGKLGDEVQNLKFDGTKFTLVSSKPGTKQLLENINNTLAAWSGISGEKDIVKLLEQLGE